MQVPPVQFPVVQSELAVHGSPIPITYSQVLLTVQINSEGKQSEFALQLKPWVLSEQVLLAVQKRPIAQQVPFIGRQPPVPAPPL
jgi:hypothetical protein